MSGSQKLCRNAASISKKYKSSVRNYCLIWPSRSTTSVTAQKDSVKLDLMPQPSVKRIHRLLAIDSSGAGNGPAPGPTVTMRGSLSLAMTFDCDATSDVLAEPELIPTYRGSLSRTRCFPCTVNLIAKAFISFFFKEPKKKTQVKITPGKRKRNQPAPAVAPVVQPTEEREEPIVEDVEVDEAGVMDEGKAEFDAATIRSVKRQAIAKAERDYLLHMTVQEETEALLLFPKVADLACLAAPVALWKLAKQLCEVLVIFADIPKLFSCAEVPLIYEVIPMLEDLEDQLTNMSIDASLPTVIRIAEMAALIVVGKYYALTDDTEVYRIAMMDTLDVLDD
ncbi:hypothetical protein B0H14DRAFT_3500412 [Mycena olivaceomarginata]|nr:hypothetical protein B0H14DRAFT_3500412 [Mycena olivaceomarginata]